MNFLFTVLHEVRPYGGRILFYSTTMLAELVEVVEQVETLEVEMMTFSEKSRLFTIILTFCLFIS